MDSLLSPAERKRQRVKAIANEAIMNTPASLAERRRLRLKAMAAELNVSDRKFREFLPMGMPFTQVGGILWFEPDEVHAWLDKFHRRGRPPGIKRTRGIKIAKKTE